jgi:hypothetical protein
MIEIIIAMFIFLLGYIMGKRGTFYFYEDSQLYSQEGWEQYSVYDSKLKAFGVGLLGMDLTNGRISPVYRPTVRFLRSKGIIYIGAKLGDFREMGLMLAPEFPFIKIVHDDAMFRARSFDE